jgi:hypothetical protein
MAKRAYLTAGKREREQKRKERQAMKDAKRLAAVQARKDAAIEGLPADPVGGAELK